MSAPGCAVSDPLFQLPEPEDVLPKRIRDMHTLYGTRQHLTCKTCKHLRRFALGTAYMKCDRTTYTHSEATDWRANWPACGLHTPNSTISPNTEDP